MPTSANDRLGQIFANKPLPSRPAPNKSDDTIIQSPTSAAPPKSDQSPINNPRPKKSTLSDDSDEDDYVAAFSQKPRMKPDSDKKYSKHEIIPSDQPKILRTDQTQSVKSLPLGKTSSSLPQDDDDNSLEADRVHKKFCQFNLVSKFPYKYMEDPQDRVSRHFFSNNKFYERTWTLYHLHPPPSIPRPPLVLVPYPEVQKLLDEIASAFDVRIKVPAFPFTVEFYKDGTPQPVFLGKSKSRDEFRDLSNRIPEPELNYGQPPPNASDLVIDKFESFHKKCEKVWLASKGKGKGKSSTTTTKSKNTFQTVRESHNQAKRAQRYLGLRPRTKPIDRPEGMSWNQEKANEQAQLRSCGLLIDFLDVSKPAQYPFDGEPLIVSIDIEWFERNNNLITEVGVSVLDTLDLVGLAPGQQGENWVKQIRSRHFRIKGREHLVNRDFCIGNPDAFRFGHSEFVALDEVSTAVDSCFVWPFSVQYKKEGPNDETQNQTATISPAETVSEVAQKGPKHRNLVILGHDVDTDLEYLQKLSSQSLISHSTAHPSSSGTHRSMRHQILSSILETLDTSRLYQSLHQELQPRSLAYICNDMGMVAWHLHNGGNDARYTLECFIKLAIRARLMEDKEHKAKNSLSEGVLEDEMEADRLRRLDEKMDHARQKIRTDLATKAEQKQDAPTITTSESTFSMPVKKSKFPVWPESEDLEEPNKGDDSWSNDPKPPRAGW